MDKYFDLISIVVPVYNVENYLIPCIDSILKQTYPYFELLLINDGSTDHSGEICDNIIECDERIKVFHKNNGGLSDARNYGMNYARGEYITFVDSDDTISPQFLELLISKAKEKNADIVQCCFSIHKEALDSGTKAEYMYNGEEGLRQFLLRGKVYVAAWAKLYKRELFKNVTFPYGRINEDHCTTYKVVYRSKRMLCLNYVLYWHRMREGSIMHTSFSERNIELANVADEIRAFLKKDQYLFKNEIDYYEYKTALIVLNALLTSSEYKNFDMQKVALKKQILSVDKLNPFLSLKDKCLRRLICANLKIYGIILRYYRKVKLYGNKSGKKSE